jgi:uncharacterized membrane protein
VRNKGVWQLVGLLAVVAAVSFVIGYFVVIRFIV